MTAGQRKAHRIIWILMILILPVFMFLAIKDLNFQSPKKKSIAVEKVSEKTILKTSENKLIKANLY